MYLKRLELLGFKSFPDKTIIKFTKGVTGIVGPNGCGKTNLLDAIRWVLGEQKVSLLRGSKMEEIIFNGTRTIKPLGMAEVTFVIQNNKGVLPTEYNEVQITRRLFRSGESEYLLNKVPCRLKDIADLLMDTGIGAHIYSVIQQDMIDAILSDRTDDRRFLFEEAAGISKYKNRKKAALRKLESTEQDLLRLKDIVAEVSTQANSLNRQMKKAERYQKYADELKTWEMFISKNTMVDYRRERQDLLSRRDSFLDERVKFDAGIDFLTAQQEEQRRQLIELDKQLTEISNTIYEKSEVAHSVEKDISILHEKRQNAKQLKEKNGLDIESFQKRRDTLLEQIENITHELEKSENDSIGIGEETGDYEKQLSEVDEQVLSAQYDRDGLNHGLMLLEGKLSAGKSDDTNLKEQESSINTELLELLQHYTSISNQKTSTISQLSELETEFQRIETQIKQIQEQRIAAENEITSLMTQSEELSGHIFELSASLEAAEARRHLLNEMITQFEGYGSGVVATLENRGKWPGLIGTIADNLTPRPGFEEAIESALGELAGFMICRDRATAEKIIEYLKVEKKGKAGLIILEEANLNVEMTRPELNTDGFLGWADSFITLSEELTPLAQLLLARIAVIDSAKSMAVINLLPPYFSAVTTDGKCFHSKAILSGGSNEGLSLFGRKEKVTEQEKILAELGTEINNLKQARSKVTAFLAARQAEVKSITLDIEKQKEDAERIEKELTTRGFELQTAENELLRVDKARQILSEKLELLRNRQYNLTLNYDQLAQEKKTLAGKLNEHDLKIGELEKKSEEIQSQLSSVQIRQIELKSKRQQLESQIRHTKELMAEIEATARSKSAEIAAASDEIKGSEEKTFLLEKELKATFDSRSSLIEKQTDIRQAHSSLQDDLTIREKEIKNLRQSREEGLNHLHSSELRLTEIDSEIRALVERIQDEYDTDLETIEVKAPDPNIPIEKAVDKTTELKEMLKNFGAVNLLALEEYHTYKERQEFLTAQMNDLLNAKSTLQSTMTKINVTAKNLFKETFEKVRGNFKLVFEELFTGGDADIQLLDPEDPLESPIEITARPRGKRLLSIAQMSGGERALTAISLLFAIYLVKPSPFCILDEIDAPLDDANIHRFLKMIKSFSDQTQFIIITHNKITMNAADILYGVTMEQPGISRVVSVRFDEDEESLIDSSLDAVDHHPQHTISESAENRIIVDIDQPTEEHNTE